MTGVEAASSTPGSCVPSVVDRMTLTTETGLATESRLRAVERGEGPLESSECDVPSMAGGSVTSAAFIKSSEVAVRGVDVEAISLGWLTLVVEDELMW